VPRPPLFPASRELFDLVRAVADEVHAADRVSDAEIGRMVGLESARTSRWKHGRISIADAGRLLAIASALDVDVSVLAHVAAGDMSAEDALEVLADDSRFVRFLCDHILLPGDGQTVTLAASNGAEARVARRAPGRYERRYRRGARSRREEPEEEPLVLLVDDDDATLEVFGSLTGPGTGIRGAVARSGPAALVAVGILRPRLVIFDLFVGQVDGFAAIRALASQEGAGAPRVVATSLSVSADVVRHARGSGASEVVQRPLRSRVLGRLLRRLGRAG